MSAIISVAVRICCADWLVRSVWFLTSSIATPLSLLILISSSIIRPASLWQLSTTSVLFASAFILALIFSIAMLIESILSFMSCTLFTCDNVFPVIMSTFPDVSCIEVSISSNVLSNSVDTLSRLSTASLMPFKTSAKPETVVLAARTISPTPSLRSASLCIFSSILLSPAPCDTLPVNTDTSGFRKDQSAIMTADNIDATTTAVSIAAVKTPIILFDNKTNITNCITSNGAKRADAIKIILFLMPFFFIISIKPLLLLWFKPIQKLIYLLYYFLTLCQVSKISSKY